jgi:CheY-like chemotaxis protein
MPYRILVIEDSDPDVFLIKEAIESSGLHAELEFLSDGQAATQHADQLDGDDRVPAPDLILLDLNLPRQSGEEVLRHFRSSRRLRDAKVLVVTSSNAPRDREAMSALSAAGYFQKPSDLMSFMRLGSVVRVLLESGVPNQP